MKLAMLAEGLDYTLLQGSLDTDITDVRYDTRAITGGEIFVCIEGYTRALPCSAPTSSATRPRR